MSTHDARLSRLVALIFLPLLMSSLPAQGAPTERELDEAARNKNGDMTQLKDLLHQGVSKSNLQSTLTGAVCEGNVEAVKVLLQFGADPKYQYGDSAMGTAPWAIFCANNTDDIKRGKVTALLIQAGLSPDWADPDEDNESLLTRAIERGDTYTAEVLLKAGANPHGVLGQKTSPLTAALANRQPALARKFIEAGERPDPAAFAQSPTGANDRYGSTFVGMVDCNATVLGVAAQKGDPESLALLLKHGKKPDPACLSGALVLATHSECGKCVTLLLNAGAHYDLNAQFSRSLSRTWFELIGDSGAEVLQAYFDHGLKVGEAKISQRDGHAYTFLDFAARDGRLDSAKWLLNHGAPVNGMDKVNTPLTLAAQAGHIEVVQALLDANADMFKGGFCRAKELAAQYNHSGIVRLLTAYGAKEYPGARLPASPFDRELTGKKQADITGWFYEAYSFLPRNLRFFIVYTEVPRLEHPPFEPDYILRYDFYLAVLPDESVVKLNTIPDLKRLGININTPSEALSYARYLSDAGINKTWEIPASTDCLSVTQEPLKKAGVTAPQITKQGSGNTLRFAVVRYLLPAAPPGDFPRVLRVTETIASDGGYSVTTETVPTPGLSIKPTCFAQ